MQLPARTLPSTPASGLSVPLDSTSLESLACFQCPLYPLFPHKDARPSGPHLKIPPASAVLIHTHPCLCFLFPPFIACYTFGKSGKSSNSNKTFVKGLPRLMIEWKDFFFYSLETNNVKKKIFDGWSFTFSKWSSDVQNWIIYHHWFMKPSHEHSMSDQPHIFLLKQ